MHVLKVFLIAIGCISMIIIALLVASVGQHPVRNLRVVIPGILLIIVFICIDSSYQVGHIKSIGTVAYKAFVKPERPGQSPYAIYVVNGEKQWLFRVPEKEFYHKYGLDKRVPLVSHQGLLSGHTYKTTLYHQ